MRRSESNLNITAILTVRNEGAFLLDWLGYHRWVGVQNFVVCSNDCDDGTDEMLDRLQAMGWITHLANPGPYRGGVQFSALKLAAKSAAVQSADWIVPLDIDEYVNVQAGGGQLADLLSRLPDADAIALTWRVFGNNGVVEFQDAPVVEQFTSAAPNPCLWPWRVSMFKTLYRNCESFAQPGVHRPRRSDAGREARWFDGSGREVPGFARSKRTFSDYRKDNFALVQLNHYPLGAMQSYILKRDRGRAVHARDLLGMNYWIDRNFDTEFDDSIIRKFSQAKAIVDELKSDLVLSRLHREACEWRRSRFDALMKDEETRDLYFRLMQTPPTKALSEAETARMHALARLHSK